MLGESCFSFAKASLRRDKSILPQLPSSKGKSPPPSNENFELNSTLYNKPFQSENKKVVWGKILNSEESQAGGKEVMSRAYEFLDLDEQISDAQKSTIIGCLNLDISPLCLPRKPRERRLSLSIENTLRVSNALQTCQSEPLLCQPSLPLDTLSSTTIKRRMTSASQDVLAHFLELPNWWGSVVPQVAQAFLLPGLVCFMVPMRSRKFRAYNGMYTHTMKRSSSPLLKNFFSFASLKWKNRNRFVFSHALEKSSRLAGVGIGYPWIHPTAWKKVTCMHLGDMFLQKKSMPKPTYYFIKKITHVLLLIAAFCVVRFLLLATFSPLRLF